MSVAERRRPDDARAHDALGRIEELLGRVAAAGDAGGTLAPYVRGGKRLRARLVVAAAAAGDGWREDDVVRYGAFVELIHAGGLCHDDVVDRSPQRRGRASIAATHGALGASLAGLHLILGGYALLADAGRAVRRAVARAAARVAAGQADEMTDLYRLDVSPERYLERCGAKTGALFELASELGARAGGVPPQGRRALVRYGAELGLAFQLIDDVLDLRGDAVEGRAAATDLREGVYTLPVLLTMARRYDGDAALQAALREVRRTPQADEAVERARSILVGNGSVDATLAVARARLARAEAALAELAPDRCAVFRALAPVIGRVARPATRATAA